MKISLITASYNSAATIADTLRSVAAQTYPDLEHIVVDGASKDETMAIVEEYGDHLADARSEPDKGIYDAYNTGLSRVSGDVIGFINSDDFYYGPHVIGEVAAAFDSANVDAVFADLIYVDPDDTDRVVRHWRGRELDQAALRRGFVPAHPTLFVRRSMFDKVGEFDTRFRLAADYDFMLRLFARHHAEARYVPQTWVRMRTGGATGAGFAAVKRQNAEIRASQRAHGIAYPAVLFAAHKAIDRSLQHLRARTMSFPPHGGAPHYRNVT
ncbi:MAG: glycosyltransferase family 2 protein [Erythrobacter sp.]